MNSLLKLGEMVGRVALVTGGAGHLGLAMAQALAEAGAQIILLDLNQIEIDKAVE